MEEERQRRLERTEMLKLLLTKKLGAKKLKTMLRMMQLMSLDDLEMEVEEVEARALELMDTEDGYVESSSEVEMNHNALSNEMNFEYDAPSTSQGSNSNHKGLGVESDEDNLKAEKSKSKWSNSSGGTTFVQIKDNSKPRPMQTISLWDTSKSGGRKRKIENESEDYGCNEAKRWCRSGPGMYM